MKLSEAIRLGSMLRPQAFNVYDDTTGTCAFGAARQAACVYDEHVEWSWVMQRGPQCPNGCGGGSAWGVITHLNDDHRWTREAIADWIATIEPVEQSTVSERTQTPDAVDVHARVSAV